MSFFTLVSSPLAADRRDRRCCVYENTPGPGFHLLLVDDDGGLVLVEQVIDFEAAVSASLVNQALAALRGVQP
jgi:hypothetical protein